MKVTIRLLLFVVVLNAIGAKASLINIQDDVFIDNYASATDVALVLDVNPITSEYVVCYAREEEASTDITCNRYDPEDSLLSSVFLDSDVTNTLFDFENIGAALSDDGEVYIMWTGSDSLNIDEADKRAFVQGFDTSGDALFDVVQTSNTDWTQASFALSPSNFWIVGSRTNIDGIEIVAEYFTNAGVAEDIITLQSGLYKPTVDACDRIVDVASNRSGDLVIAWAEPNETEDTCGGTIYAQTYRESGSVISDVVQLSDTEEDDDGNDVSAYLEPVNTAYEDGEYVVAWTDDASIYSALLLLDGDIADSQEELLTGAVPRIGGNSANQDFVVIGEATSGSSCTITARLVFDANIDPETTFTLGDCGFSQTIAFQADGKMVLARTTTETAAGQIVINRIDLPAEIEVNEITVLEGDPTRGQQNVAVVDVSLTRPHPAGDDIEVSYFTRDNTALVGIDYTIAQGTLTFSGSAAETTQSFQVPIIGDSVFEDDEIFEVNLESAVNAVLKNEGDSANVTILDDDMTPDIVANCDNDNANDCQQIDEPGTTGTSTELVVSLVMDGTVDADVFVNFETVDGTATAGEDYLANSGSLEFPAGSTTAQFAVTILGDEVSEDTETFTVELSGADTVSLPDTELTFSIINETLCNLDLSPDPNDAVFTSAGGSETIVVTSSLSDCDWEVALEDVGDGTDWITLNTSSGSGLGLVNFDVDPFDPPDGDSLARNMNINVTLSDTNVPFVEQTLTFAVGQDGDCSFTIDSDSASFDVDGGTGSFTVTPNDQSCEWSATSDEDWVTIDSPTSIATGTGSVAYTVADNAGETNVENAARSFTLISEEFSYTIDQSGCTYSLDSNSIDAEASDSTATVEVLAPTEASGECAWTAVSNSSWILISDGASGSGGGTVSLAILDNASVDARTGTVTIGDETLEVNQAGQECDYSVDSDSFSICPDGDSFDIDITATDGCSWSLESLQDWTEVLTNATGSGSESSSGQVLDNLSESDRSGSIELISSVDNSVAATIDFVQDGFLIYEPFDAGLPDDWVFDPDSSWSVSDSQLFGFSLNAGIATALDLSNACSNCLIESTVTLTTATNASMDALSLIGWSVSENNQVLLSMDEFNNVWRLTQIASGVATSVESDEISIVPGIAYDIALGFDGIDFFAEVDGERVASLTSSNSEPSGFTGFRINNNNAIFTELRVTGSASDADVVFSSGFEAPDPLEISVCTL